MNARKISLYAALFVLIALPATAQQITVSGTVSPPTEWDGIGISATDPNEVGISDPADIQYVYLTCDSNFIYFRLDTYSTPVAWSANETFYAYLDTDQDTATGCDDLAQHGGTGYERQIEVRANNLVKFTYQCVSGSWVNATFEAQALGLGVDILEVRAPLGAGTNLGDFCGDPIDFFVFFDNGTTDPDDEIPDSGSETLIELASFTARPFGSAVQVEWVTASEIDNAGFNLYRKTANDTDWAKLNGALIPAEGGPTWPADYEFIDDAVSAGVKYYYLLEDLDVYGASTTHGPVWVKLPNDGEAAPVTE